MLANFEHQNNILNKIEYWNSALNKIEYDVIKKNYPPRYLGYRIGFLTACIEHQYYNGELTHDEYRSLYDRADEIYIEVER